MARLTIHSKFDLICKLIFVVIIGLVIYSPALNGEFISDDYRLVAINPAIINFDGIKPIWHSFNTRLLVGLSYAWSYQLHHLNPFGYHLFSLIVHIINTILVYIFCYQTVSLFKQTDKIDRQANGNMAFLASVIFLCHPVQTQAVSAIAQRGTLMVCSFYLLAHIFYIVARIKRKPVFLGLVFIPLVLGFITKETMISVAISLCVYEWFFFKDNADIPRISPKWLWSYLFITLMFPVIFFQNKPNADINFRHLMGVELFDWNVFLTEINVLTTYLRLFILPIDLKSDYYYPVTQTIWEPRLWLSIIILGALLFLMVKWFKRKRIYSFCILWFFLTKPVEFLGVTFGLRNLIYENWLYLTMVGLCLAASSLLVSTVPRQKVYPTVVIVLVTILCLMTNWRNNVWRNEIGHYKDLVKKEPFFPSAYLGLSDAYKRKGNIKQSIMALHEAIRVKPDFPHAHNNLGIHYANHREDQKALIHFKKAIESDPDFFGVYQNIGYLHYLRGEYKQAIDNYRHFLDYRPQTADCFYYIGMSYLKMMDKQQAKENLLKARKIYGDQQMLQKISLIDEHLEAL